MKEISIIINDDTLTGISGHSFGEKLYIECVKDNIDLTSSEKYVLVFPEFVEAIAVSFVKGFTKSILKQIAVSEFYDHFEIRGTEYAVGDFKDGVEY